MARDALHRYWRLAVLGILSGLLTPKTLPQASAAHGPTATGRSVQEQIDVLEHEARAAFERGDYASARKTYERLILLEPGSAGPWNNLGVCYHFEGRLHDAVETLTRALKLDPNLVSANLIVGIDQVQLNHAQEAIPFLEKALQNDGANRDAMLALASAEIALGRFEQGAKAYQREVALRPGDADAWYGMGLCFEHLAEDTTHRMAEFGTASTYTLRLIGEFLTERDDGVDAIEVLTHALASGGDQAGVHAALGFARLRAGDVLEGEKQFTTERQLHPGNLDAKLGLADVAIENQDFQEAERLLCEVYRTDQAYFQSRLNFFLASLHSAAQSSLAAALKAGTFTEPCASGVGAVQTALTSPQSSTQLKDSFASPTVPRDRTSHQLSSSGSAAAQAARKSGHYSECFKSMSDAGKLTPGDALLFASCACLSGHFFVGFEAARSALEHDPHSMPALYWQAETARKLAQAAFQQSLSLNPDAWQGQILLGDLFRQRKQWEQAVSHYQQAARLKPLSPAPFLGLGTVYWQLGQNDQAETALRKALELQPDNASAELELGNVYIREHRFEEAAPMLEKGLGRNPDRLSAHADLGQAYRSLGRKQEAIRELERAAPIDQLGDIHYQLYRLYKEEGESRRAEAALAESERLRATELERHRERTERAMEIQRRGAQPAPKHP